MFKLLLCLCIPAIIFNLGSAKDEICNLPRSTGICRAALRRYTYNPRTQECERFYYGGCGGNKNNFKELAACEKACKNK